jgi:CRP-like cAMP-binding protein
VALGTWGTYQAGEALVQQGGSSRDLFVITEGRVRVVMATAAGDELLLAVLGPGSTVGELSVLDGEPRSASAFALEPVRALRVGGRSFGQFLLARPQAVVGLLRVLSGRLRAADELRLQLSIAPAEQRLARGLLALAAQHGRVTDEGVRLAAPLSQADLAGYVGLSREAVNQGLRALREAGLVATARRSVMILDLDGLRGRAAG